MLTRTDFGKNLDMLQRAMSVYALRRNVIANNVANAETPNFKRSEVSFEANLSRAIASEKQPDSIGIITHPDHIPFHKVMDYRKVRPAVKLDYLTTAENNGNNVDIEHELKDATQNQMMYELTSQVVGHKFRRLNIVLR